MIAFWIAALGAVALAAGLMFLFSRRPLALVSDPAQAVYRRQLAEIDDLAGRGLLGEEERQAAYAEAARRLLGEPGADAERPSTQKDVLLASAAIGLVGVVALGAYLAVGAPGMPDQPYRSRLEAWVSQVERGGAGSLSPEQAVAVLSTRRSEFEGEAGYWASLGQMQGASGDLLGAQNSYERSLSLEPNNPDVLVELAQVRMALARNEVTPQARQALNRALAIDPQNLVARYILATDAIAQGRKTEGVATLRELLPVVPPQARAQIEQDIAAAEGLADSGPASQAAADPAIRAMVEGLANRLKAEPDDPQGWARLVRSYQVMGDIAARDAALAEARRLFANRPRDLATVEQAADVPQ